LWVGRGRGGQGEEAHFHKWAGAAKRHLPFPHLVGSGGLGDGALVEVAEAVHVHVAFGAPGLAGDVAEAGADQEQGGVAVGEGADHAGAAPDLAHDALQRVVRAQGAVVFRGEG
jgi:hypothetical protein